MYLGRPRLLIAVMGCFSTVGLPEYLERGSVIE